ncbi:9099_t:CDS:2, partial [Acaulospora colombiana]
AVQPNIICPVNATACGKSTSSTGQCNGRSWRRRAKMPSGSCPKKCPVLGLIIGTEGAATMLQRSYHHPSTPLYSGDQYLFYEMARSDQAKLLKALDVYFGDIPNDIYALIRTLFIGLEYLTIRGSFGGFVGPLWIDTNNSYWGAYSNLTRLQLIDCSNVYTLTIPAFIRHFPSLEYLLISACPYPWRTEHGRAKGWSSLSDGWWNIRKPLKAMHIECMLKW